MKMEIFEQFDMTLGWRLSLSLSVAWSIQDDVP